MSCRAMFLKWKPYLLTFEEAFGALEQGSVDLAMIAVDNSLAGRVADVHHLLPQKKMFIIGEHFQPVSMCLLAIKGAQLSDLKTFAIPHALPQCRKVIKDLGLIPHVHADTAGAAEDVAQWNDKASVRLRPSWLLKSMVLRFCGRYSGYSG